MRLCCSLVGLILATHLATGRSECVVDEDEAQSWPELSIHVDEAGEKLRVSVPALTSTTYEKLFKCDLLAEISLSEGNKGTRLKSTTSAVSSLSAGLTIESNLHFCQTYTVEIALSKASPKAFSPLSKQVRRIPSAQPLELDFHSGYDTASLELDRMPCEGQDLDSGEIRCQPEGSEAWIRFHGQVVGSSLVFAGLVPNKTYACSERIELSYNSSLGNGSFDAKSAVTLQTPTAEVRVEPVPDPEQGKLRVSLVSEVPGAKRTLLWASRAGDGGSRSATSNASSYAIDGLQPEAEYKVCLKFSPEREIPDCDSACESSECRSSVSTLPGRPAQVEGFRVSQDFKREVRLRWNRMDEARARGTLTSFELVMQGTARTDIPLCPSQGLHRKTFRIAADEDDHRLTKLRSHYDYSFQIRARTARFDGPWAEIKWSTRDDLQRTRFTERDVAWSVHNSSRLRVRVKPKCVHADPVYISVYQHLFEAAPLVQDVLYDRHKAHTEIVVESADKFLPARSYILCIKLCLPADDAACGSSHRPRHCQKVTIPEEPPAFKPLLTVTGGGRQATSRFNLSMREPEANRATVAAYDVRLEEQCLLEQDPRCPPCKAFAPSQRLTVRKDNGRPATGHSVSSGRPGRRYRVTAAARNSAGRGPEAAAFVSTPASLAEYESGFAYSTGRDFVSLMAAPVCPFQGEASFTFTLTQIDPIPKASAGGGGGARSLAFGYGLRSGAGGAAGATLAKTFPGLRTGHTYSVCMKVKLVNCSASSCISDPHCKYVQVRCSRLSAAARALESVPWASRAPFNPFSEVMLLVREGTFNVTHAGVANGTVEAYREDSLVRRAAFSADINWDGDSRVVVAGLEPGTAYRVRVTAHGCENSRSTDYLQVRTLAISPARIGIVNPNATVDKKNLSAAAEGQVSQAFTITEQRVNIEYKIHESYSIGDLVISDVFHPNKSSCAAIQCSEEVCACELVLQIPAEDLV